MRVAARHSLFHFFPELIDSLGVRRTGLKDQRETAGGDGGNEFSVAKGLVISNVAVECSTVHQRR